jgi:glutathione S-transferase
MARLTIYGSPRSRTMRVLWMATELGLDYAHVPYEADDPALKEPAFRRINPAGTIPAIRDGELTLSESLAINLYLAKTYGAGRSDPLYPGTADGEAQAWRWSLWANQHLEPWVMRDALLAELRAAIGDRAKAMIQASLTVLERVLVERPWLLGDGFTVADLNVAAVLSPSRASEIDFGSHHRVEDWLARCYARPAATATRARFQA